MSAPDPEKIKNAPNFRIASATRDAFSAILKASGSGLSLTEFINAALAEVAGQIQNPGENIPMLPIVAILRSAMGKRSLQQAAVEIATDYEERFRALDARIASLESLAPTRLYVPPAMPTSKVAEE